MKLHALFTPLILLLAITACNQTNQQAEDQTKGQHTQIGVTINPTNQLGILIEHAIIIMTQGAELKLHPLKGGDLMLAQSADLLRRAMSGPEMSEMHKAGEGHSPAMQRTHDLGAAAFDLLDLMMSLKEPSNIKNIRLFHYALSMASEGSNLKSLAHLETNKQLAKVLQQQGHDMRQASINLTQALNHDGAYPQAVLKVIKLLTAHEKNMPKEH
ncbi:MAG: hypothetical protein Q9M20_07715 [Mariprofundaceae bacterium]|nr:hypothetical protein [Mariprofundaceae bacterium]